MFEYFKRKFVRLDGKITVSTFPKYYEENGKLIKEEENGQRFLIKLDENKKPVVIGEINE